MKSPSRDEFKDNFRFINKFDKDSGDQVGAGSIGGLMPSIDEPGGLANQELALVLVFMIVAEGRVGRFL